MDETTVANQLQAKLKKELKCSSNIPTVFIDALHDQNDFQENKVFDQETEKLKMVVLKSSPFHL